MTLMRMKIPCAAKDERIRRVCEELTRDVSLRLTDLARLVGLSSSRLQHLFSDETGVNIREYKREVRLQRARQLLQQTDIPIKAIAVDIGIPDRSNFIKYFKARFGITPAAYRLEAAVNSISHH
jgi:AraC family transcriptional regulator, arabinose operon regulatory protein